MHRTLGVIALSLLAGGVVLAAVFLGSSWPDPQPVDTAIRGMRLDVDAGRRLTIALDVANAGAAESAPLSVFVHTLAIQHTDWLAPLPPHAARTWAWRSPPLAPGDYEVVVSVDPRGSVLDADESNNVARAVLRVPKPSARGSGSGARTRTPSVHGLARRDASRALREAGLAEPDWYEPAGGAAIDRVDLQWPAAGARVPARSEAVLVAAATRTVPALVGARLDRAREQLKDAGLVPGALHVERSLRTTSRTVRAQVPEPGSRIDAGAAVSLVVSDRRPWWPLVVSALMLALAVMAGTVARALRPARAARAEAWVDTPVARLPERALAFAADAPLAVGEAPPVPVVARPVPPLVAERPRRPEPMAPPPAPPEPEPERLTIDDLRFEHVPDAARITVTWQGDADVSTVAFRVVRDRGTQDVRWHAHEGSTR